MRLLHVSTYPGKKGLTYRRNPPKPPSREDWRRRYPGHRERIDIEWRKIP